VQEVTNTKCTSTLTVTTSPLYTADNKNVSHVQEMDRKELEKMWKGAVTACCKLLTLYVLGRNFKIHQKCVAIVCVLFGFERGFSGMGVKSHFSD